MTPKVVFSVSAVSMYLLTFLIFIYFEQATIVSWMFAFSPFMIIWMVYTVLRHGVYTGVELQEDEEWGYEDKNREDLGIF